MVQTLKKSWTTFKTIFTGMGVTMRHLLQPSVTLRYPEERDELPSGARSKLFVHIDDCIGCKLCERACPVNCIAIETVQATKDVDLGKTSTGNPKRFWITTFNIDMSKCMYCDMCVPPCPTECISMVPEYEYSEYDRNNLLFQFSELSADKVTEVKEKAEKEQEEKQRKKKEAARKKKAQKADQTSKAKQKNSEG
ncbi:NuoI/complex I 23 kDa subunit family protein [Fodinibius sediminis]|uniref:NADH-quinone oxidoreductase subunit I n=1 Tax=Fodinibius sediminis TaxID=1214077 RepID=A0A521D0X6_9BACT|nr:NADH-quinone oxidoreductase subunit I [Fodinibius sediminis]SMO64550.1 NADH-quinone oxidoreductase subunit I [Fodinibius sediminis]